MYVNEAHIDIPTVTKFEEKLHAMNDFLLYDCEDIHYDCDSGL